VASAAEDRGSYAILPASAQAMALGVSGLGRVEGTTGSDAGRLVIRESSSCRKPAWAMAVAINHIPHLKNPFLPE